MFVEPFLWGEGLKSSKDCEIIASGEHDLDGDEVPELIHIVLIDGGFQANDSWERKACVGLYNIRIIARGNVLSEQSLKDLFYPGDKDDSKLVFHERFSLILEDYNDAGQTDFNIGQYGASQFNSFKLFTISRSGKVMTLPIL